MPSFDLYKKIHGSGTNGEVRKRISDDLMEHFFWEDIGAKKAYIYDYFHDDEQLSYFPMNSQRSKIKTPIDIKFIVNSYNTESKDQVGYHIQFRPSQECPINYYDEYHKKYSAEFPIGCYIDIPDEKGKYRKWLITENANWLDLQFPTYYVLPVDHVFQWIYKGKKYQMCGVSRSQSSYNAGVWVDFKLEQTENQRKCVLPLNSISETIFYNQRLIISAPLPEPITWRVTKLETLSPKGIERLTFAQSEFDPHHDFIEKDEEGNVIGMWADYWTEGVQPTIHEEPETKIYSQITYTGLSPKIKIGGNYRTFTVKFYDDVGEVPPHTGEWKFTIADTDVSEYVSIKKDSALQNNQIKFKFIGDDGYIGKNLVISYISEDNIKSSVEMNICGL